MRLLFRGGGRLNQDIAPVGNGTQTKDTEMKGLQFAKKSVEVFTLLLSSSKVLLSLLFLYLDRSLKNTLKHKIMH